MKPSEPHETCEYMLYESSWDYDFLDRKAFAWGHEGFFKQCIQEMGSRNSHILMDRWFGPGEFTLEDIGRRYGISRERVRSIEYKAFRIIFRAIKAMWEGK